MTSDLPPSLCPNLTAFHQQISHGDLRADTTQLAPGVLLHADPELQLTGRYSSSAGRFLDLHLMPQGTGDWLGLHLPLPQPDFTDIDYFGFVCRAAASASWMLRACLRSGFAEGGFRDCFFDKHLLTSARPHSHMDALYLDSHPNLPLQAPWRELVLFLPRQDCQLNLLHLYPFVL